MSSVDQSITFMVSASEMMIMGLRSWIHVLAWLRVLLSFFWFRTQWSLSLCLCLSTSLYLSLSLSLPPLSPSLSPSRDSARCSPAFS